MSTQIQTTAGEVAKAYEIKVIEAQNYYDEGVKRYEAARAEWDARSWWYRLWSSKEPDHWRFYDEGHIRRVNETCTFYADLDPATTVLLNEFTAQYLDLGKVSSQGN